MEVPAIEHSVYINASPDEVYDTLTTGVGWDAWFTNGTTVDPRQGGEIRLRWKNFGAGHITTEDGGTVLEAVTNQKFVFQWSPSNHPTTVSMTLVPRGEGTLLTVRETGYELNDLKAFMNCATGWGEALTLLKFYLEYGLTYGSVPD